MISRDSVHNSNLNISALGMTTADDIVIEPLYAHDALAVSELVRLGIGAYEEAGTVVASTFRRLQDILAIYNQPGSAYIVAKDKRQIDPDRIQEASKPSSIESRSDQMQADFVIGGAGIGPLHGLSPLEGLGEIRDLVVRPEWRGNGIGARLLKRCLEEAKRLGYQRLYLEATPQMEQAQKLFMRYGFRPVTTGSPKMGQGHSMPCYYILEALS